MRAQYKEQKRIKKNLFDDQTIAFLEVVHLFSILYTAFVFAALENEAYWFKICSIFSLIYLQL